MPGYSARSVKGGAFFGTVAGKIAYVKRSFAKSVALAAMLVAGLVVVAVPDYRWRTIVAARKVTGLLENVTWKDLRDIAAPGSGFELKHLARWGDPYATIEDPYTSESDRNRGRELFALNCVKCHGAEAKGGLAPALVGRALKHGDSDWALYLTITRGVPGSPMAGGLVERRDIWRVITFLRELGHSGSMRTGLSGSDTALPDPAPEVTYEHLVASSKGVGEWLLPGGSYDGKRYSRDTEVNAGNVSGLSVQWIHQLPPSDAPNESGPIVSGRYLYVTVPPGTVVALDAQTGAQVWQYTRAIPSDIHLCCLATSRGLAAIGSRVYLGTLDAHLIALDATTGKLIWDQTVADYKTGYSITSAPLPVGDLVITGIAGSEYPIRGFISAYDASSGALRWRFNTVPGAGEPAAKTWGGDSWKNGGGATWGTGAYDPELGLVYWGVATAAPDFNAALRPGDNLYANCLLALDATTGKLAWYFQFLPGDDHDWDSIQTPSLFDVDEGGRTQRLLAVANRGGFFYVLDRQTGRFIRGAPFSRQTWAVGLDASGRPIRAPMSSPSEQGTYLYPSLNGATNWWPSAYSPLARLYYVNVEEAASVFFTKEDSSPTPGHMYLGGTATTSSEPAIDSVKAIDPTTATVRWERKNTVSTTAPRGGLLATAGGLLFGSDGTRLYSLDAVNGRELWSFNAGAHISAPPMTFRIGNKQVVAVVAGHDLITFSLPSGPKAAPRATAR
jgi:alcohol dehydrogenase (cytochrome c)